MKPSRVVALPTHSRPYPGSEAYVTVTLAAALATTIAGAGGAVHSPFTTALVVSWMATPVTV